MDGGMDEKNDILKAITVKDYDMICMTSFTRFKWKSKDKYHKS